MSHIDDLVEQHVREYQSRLGYVDELLGRARGSIGEGPEDRALRARLEELEQERHRLADWLEDIKRTPPADWREEEIRQAGPMGIWDAVAQQLEKLVERRER
jgi:hypothetical protein